MAFSEVFVLNYLQKQIDLVASSNNELVENGIELDKEASHFSITVGGIPFTFILGGPQMAALELFIEWIAYENMHPIETPFLDNITNILAKVKGGE